MLIESDRTVFKSRKGKSNSKDRNCQMEHRRLRGYSILLQYPANIVTIQHGVEDAQSPHLQHRDHPCDSLEPGGAGGRGQGGGFD